MKVENYQYKTSSSQRPETRTAVRMTRDEHLETILKQKSHGLKRIYFQLITGQWAYSYERISNEGTKPSHDAI